MIDKKSWQEFRDSGFLSFTNTILHLFGWAIVLELDDDQNIVDVYPARIKFKRFSRNVRTSGRQQVIE